MNHWHMMKDALVEAMIERRQYCVIDMRKYLYQGISTELVT